MSMDFSIFFTYNYLTKKNPSNRCSIYAKSTRDWIIFLTSEKDWKIFHKIPSNCCSIYAKSRRDWKIFLTSEKDKPISDFFAEIPTYNRVMGILRKIKSEIKNLYLLTQGKVQYQSQATRGFAARALRLVLHLAFRESVEIF